MIVTRLVSVFILLYFCSAQVHRETGRAAHEQFPHQVEILMGYDGGSGAISGGTGTLISERWVLTCAHNLQRYEDRGAVTSVEARVPSKGLSAVASEWYAHDSYDLNRDSSDYYDFDEIDIALVKLKAPLTDGNAPASVTPASLPRASDVIEDMSEVRFAGYGENDRDEEGVLFEGRSYKLPGYLSGFLEFELDGDNEAHHTRKKAEDIYYHFKFEVSEEKKRAMNRAFEKQLPNHIFTGVKRPHDIGPHTGHGDSGCGLFKMEGHTVYGVLSAADYCKDRSEQFTWPITWVRVSNQVAWIEGTMKSHDEDVGRSNSSVAVLAALYCVCVYFL